ncbi:MAG: penicillin-binding protein 1C [Pontiellaceae bacterium]|nr:penicillin-binding protein 1C [Pontiellaceae bacterium]
MSRIGKRTLGKIGLVAMAAFGVVWLLMPDYCGDLEDFDAVATILDRNGKPLRVVPDPSTILCEPVPLDQTGEWTAKALVAFEDKRFYEHGGVDSIAVCRAMLQNVLQGRVVSGASTLTTLVVKMTEPRSRNLWTKLVEAHHARQLEARLTKDEILEQYLNRAPFGGNVYGIEAASKRYFGKPARNLSLAESAMLAGLPQSPSRLRPDRYLKEALDRRDVVLWRMFENDMITRDQMQEAHDQPITLRREALPFLAPHFCDYLLQRHPGNERLDTTLDLGIQQVAESALQRRIEELSPFGVSGGAVVVIDVRSGELRAMVGSPDFWNTSASGQVNGTVAGRSPGSTLKPFAYAAAMDQGLCTPATMMADIPMRFAGYDPQNYSLEYMGPVSVRQALVQSLNIPALQCVEQIGLESFVAQLRRLGFSTLDHSASHYGLGIVVGSSEMTLLDLSNAYACLARNGIWQPLRVLADEPVGEPRSIYSAEAAYMMADILGGDERSTDLVGHMADAVLPRVAWKTGTSSGHRDAWTVAYNPEYVVGVWLGNPDGSPSDALVGGSAAGPVAGEIFRRLYPCGDSPWFEMPDGIQTRAVCACSGLVPCADCAAAVEDYYIPRISPTQPCAIHRDGGEHWPAELQAFMERRGMGDAVADREDNPLGIETPVDGETYRLLPAAPGIRQEMRIAASGSGDTLYWFVDNELLCAASSADSVYWPLEKGAHTIACADASGRAARVRIVVE